MEGLVSTATVAGSGSGESVPGSGPAAPAVDLSPQPADDRPSVYLEGDKVVYRASALGGCFRALVAGRMGYEPLAHSEDTLRRMAEGNLHEGPVLAKLAEAGWLIHARQMELDIPVGRRIIVRCHVDGIAHAPDHPATHALVSTIGEEVPDGCRAAVEVKSMGKDPYKKWLSAGSGAAALESFPDYAWQASVEMAATGLPLLYAVKCRDSGALDVRLIERAPFTMAQVKARVAKVEAAAARGELSDCEASLYSWSCPFRYLHDPTAKEPLEVATDPELDALAATYDKARAMVKVAEAMKAEARDRLVAALGARAGAKVVTPAWSVGVSITNRTVKDFDGLARVAEAAGIDPSPFVTLRPVESISVKARAPQD